MARYPRSCFVYKKLHKYRYLPRRNDGIPEFDYDEMNSTPENFEEKLENPPKLWVAWLYKAPSFETKSNRKILFQLFGPKYFELNKPNVFKNTPYWNNLLWKIKHLIEINPITFPNGEPTVNDITKMNLTPDTGQCTIDEKKFIDQRLLDESDKNNWHHQIDEKTVRRRLNQRWFLGDEIQEDSPYSLPHRSDF